MLGWLAMLVVSWLALLLLLLPEGRWRFMRPQWRLLFPELRGSLVLYVKDVSSTISMFLDRFLISLFLGLELTGVYTLFWSITNVVHSLAVYDIIKAQLPSLIASGRNPEPEQFRAHERRLQIEIGSWSLLLALGAGVAMPLLLPLLHQPLAQESLPVFWLILLATLLRIAADLYGFVLLALRRDRTIAWVAAAGALASAGLNLVLTPFLWLGGRRCGLRDDFGRFVGCALRPQPDCDNRAQQRHARTIGGVRCAPRGLHQQRGNARMKDASGRDPSLHPLYRIFILIS